MKIILSPAKKMNIDLDTLDYIHLPEYLPRTEEILAWLRSKSRDELQKLWSCNDKIAAQNFERLEHMHLYKNLTPAILSYEGIAYQYMAPAVFETQQLAYVQEHLRIVCRLLRNIAPHGWGYAVPVGNAGESRHQWLQRFI